jgi:hypothetical protein
MCRIVKCEMWAGLLCKDLNQLKPKFWKHGEKTKKKHFFINKVAGETNRNVGENSNSKNKIINSTLAVVITILIIQLNYK